MSMYRIMATLQDTSGLPRDRYVNTMYVNTIVPFADPDASLLTINQAVRDFYIAIGPNFSGQVSGSGHTVKAYDMGLPPGTRVPISPVTFTISPSGGGMPAEVALVVTLEATPQAGVQPMSTKGRIYLGPLSVSMLVPGTSTDTGRPLPAGVGAFLSAAQAMVEAVNDIAGASLVVASTRQDKADLAVGSRQAYPVVAVSIDNEWDTQRSRGHRSTLRARAAIAGAAPGLPRSW